MYYLVKYRTPKQDELFLSALLPGTMNSFYSNNEESYSTISNIKFTVNRCLYFKDNRMHYTKMQSKLQFVQTTNQFEQFVIVSQAQTLSQLVSHPRFNNGNYFVVDDNAVLLIAYFVRFGTMTIHGTLECPETSDSYHKRAIRFDIEHGDVYPLVSSQSMNIPWFFVRGLSKKIKKSLEIYIPE